jgi:hypothetical protein
MRVLCLTALGIETKLVPCYDGFLLSLFIYYVCEMYILFQMDTFVSKIPTFIPYHFPVSVVLVLSAVSTGNFLTLPMIGLCVLRSCTAALSSHKWPKKKITS